MVPRPDAVQSRAVDAGVQGIAAAVRLLAVRRRRAALHRRSFAWMELVLVASTIAQRWRLRLVPGHPVVPQPVVTLRLKHGLRMTLERRHAA